MSESETPLNKRYLNLLARRTYEAGKLDLKTVEILEARGHDLSEIRLMMGEDVKLKKCKLDRYHPNYSKVRGILKHKIVTL